MGAPFDRFPKRPQYCEFFEDFTGVDDSTLQDLYEAILTAGGTIAIRDSANGSVRISGAATTDDSGAGLFSRNEFIKLGLGVTVEFAAKIAQSDATQRDFIAGLGVKAGGTSWLSSAPTDRVVFAGTDGTQALRFEVYKASVEVLTQTGIITPSDAADIILAFRIVMDSADAGVGAVTVWAFTSSGEAEMIAQYNLTGMPYSEELGWGVEYISGNNTGTKTIDVDYVGVRETR